MLFKYTGAKFGQTIEKIYNQPTEICKFWTNVFSVELLKHIGFFKS